MKHIFWVSSYPKSGNTLLRSILISLFFTKNGIFNLSMLSKIDQFESCKLVSNNKKIFKDDYSRINDIPTFYKYLLKLQSKEILKFNESFTFFKSHSGNFNIGNNNFTTEKNTRGIIYIIRDPRDVCVSLANHLNKSINYTVNFMTNDIQSLHWWDSGKYFEEKEKPSSFLSSWGHHVDSWTLTNWNVPLKIIKFEDLVYNKEKTIRQIIDFFHSNYNFEFNNLDTKIKNILKITEFKKFKERETAEGFSEASFNNFFSKGEYGQWRNKLSKIEQFKIIDKFKNTMKRFDYEIKS